VRFLLDEDVAREVGEFLAERGHHVFYVGVELVKGSVDPLLAQWVHVNEGIVVTHNYKHFQRLVSRIPEGGRTKFRKASRLTLSCRETQALRRLREFIVDIEAEYDECQNRSDKRMMCELGTSYFKKER